MYMSWQHSWLKSDLCFHCCLICEYSCFCISRDGTKKDHERSELQPKKRQTSTEGSGYSLQNQPDSAPSSPHSKISPRFSPCRPTTPPFSVATQPLLITSSQVQSSKALSMTSPSDAASFSKQHSMHFAASTSSQSMITSGTNRQEKLNNATGRPAPISLLPSGEGQRKVQNHVSFERTHICILVEGYLLKKIICIHLILIYSDLWLWLRSCHIICLCFYLSVPRPISIELLSFHNIMCDKSCSIWWWW